MSVAAAITLIRANRQAAPGWAWRAVASHVRRSAGYRSDADDVVQDVLLAVMCMTESLAHPAAWLNTVTRNAVIDRRRRDARERSGRVDVEVESLPDERVAADGARAQASAVLSGIAAAISLSRGRGSHAHLQPQMRALLHRSLGGDLSDVRDAAELPCGLSDDVVSKWIERGREPLLEMLDAIGDRHAESEAAIEALRMMVAARRGDAGQPRVARRRAA